MEEGPGLGGSGSLEPRGSSLGADLGEGLGLLDDLLLEPRGHLLVLEELQA